VGEAVEEEAGEEKAHEAVEEVVAQAE